LEATGYLILPTKFQSFITALLFFIFTTADLSDSLINE